MFISFSKMSLTIFFANARENLPFNETYEMVKHGIQHLRDGYSLTHMQPIVG